MGRKPIGKEAMTPAERTRRWRREHNPPPLIAHEVAMIEANLRAFEGGQLSEFAPAIDWPSSGCPIEVDEPAGNSLLIIAPATAHTSVVARFSAPMGHVRGHHEFIDLRGLSLHFAHGAKGCPGVLYSTKSRHGAPIYRMYNE
jgi:hypothetical protein